MKVYLATQQSLWPAQYCSVQHLCNHTPLFFLTGSYPKHTCTGTLVPCTLELHLRAQTIFGQWEVVRDQRCRKPSYHKRWSFHYHVMAKASELVPCSLQCTSPLEFNAIFRDGFSLWHELTAGSKIRDSVPAKFKHVTNIVICPLLCCDTSRYVPALKFPKSWLRTLGYRPKIHHSFFSHKWVTRFKYLSFVSYAPIYSCIQLYT